MSSLERRARDVRARNAIRAWEYRQRRHSKGVWFRLRRVLADARLAYVITDAAALDFLSRGYQPEPVGNELEPKKTIVFVPEELVTGSPDARLISVRLDAELLAAPCLALVRFPDSWARCDSGHPSAPSPGQRWPDGSDVASCVSSLMAPTMSRSG